jgi:type 1 glutamine amidotransferase
MMLSKSKHVGWCVRFVAVGLIGCSLASSALAGPAAKILLVATPPDHPWAAHMYEFDCHVLAKCLRQTKGVEAEVVVGWPADSRRLNDVSSLVFYSRPAGEIVLHPGHRERFMTLMDRGVGFVAIHWGTGVGYTPLADDPDVRDTYKNVLGGWFRRPPCGIKITKAMLHQKAADHPLCRGWSGYEIHDEFYLNPVLHERARPILQVSIGGTDQTVAWSHERSGTERGRSIGISLGHYHDNFKREAFRRALVNAILWTARVDVPNEGAPVVIDPQELELPQRPE